MTAIASLFASNVGKQVTIVNKATGLPTKFRVSALSDKMGTLKSGDKAAYVVLTGEDDTSIVINLHPQAASALFKKGTEANMTITGDAEVAVKTADPVVEALVATVANENNVMTADQIEADSKQPSEDKPTVDETPEQVNCDAEKPAEKKVSKKEQAIQIFKDGVAAGLERKDIIARFRTELNMGVPGSNTYYQNIKSGAWA